MGLDERIERDIGLAPVASSLRTVLPAGTSALLRADWEMDAEYARLEAWIRALRLLPECTGVRAGHPGDTPAPCCSETSRAVCAEGIRVLGTDMIDFMSEHFAQENTLMRRGNGIRGLRELFELHAEDHGCIMSSVVNAIELPTPCAQKRALAVLLDNQVRRHLLTHDASLREQLPRLCYEPARAAVAR